MAEITETLLVQKLDRNNWNGKETTDNFAEDKELTVTITLAEYRELIAKNSVSKYELDKEKQEKYEIKRKLEEAIKQREELSLMLFNFQQKTEREEKADE